MCEKTGMMLTYIVPLYLDAIDRHGAAHLSQRVEQGVGKWLQEMEAAQSAAQPVQALVHTLQRRPAAKSHRCAFINNAHPLSCWHACMPNSTCQSIS